MTEQNISFLKRRFHLPNLQESVYILRTLPFWTKAFVLILGAIFLISSLLLGWKTNNRLLVVVPELGGSLTEGVVGAPRFINPLIAITDAERDLSSLIYSGLMRPDSRGGLVTDLAEKYEVSEDGLIYTFTLKPNLTWHDGEKLTTDDIIFTIQRAKDPVLKSAKRASWEGVATEKIDDNVIKFILKKPYSPFLENVTLGILPKHIWQNIPSEQMLYSEYNTSPIGSGPYKIGDIARDSSGNVNSYALLPNDNFALPGPYLKKITLKFYLSEKEAVNAYKNGEIGSTSGISPAMMDEIILKCDSGQQCDRGGEQTKVINLPRVFAVFFNQNKSKALLQKEVRQALSLATDKNRLVQEVLKGYGNTLGYPIPNGSLGALEPQEEKYSVEEAKNILTKSGWKQNQDGIFEKQLDKKETITLEISIATSADSEELKSTAKLLKEMWQQAGVKVDVLFFETGDLQKTIAERNYQALLFGESIGHDPDPFAFWHSSQKDYPGANVAMYTNSKVDKLLEDSRRTSDREDRVNKYKQFQEEVQKDAPAVFLFSPSFIYILPEEIKGDEELASVANSSERFAQAHNWYIHTNKIWRFFAK